MPSPFPGMDPFLEDPGLWQSFHGLFAGQIAIGLNRVLPEGCVALFGERCYVLLAPRDYHAEVAIKRVTEQPTRGATATLPSVDEAAPTGVIHLLSEKVREYYVEIVMQEDRRQAFTAIELLSPTNKNPRQQQAAYLRKQAELLNSETNLVEVDLLRGGAHTVAVPRAHLEEYGHWDYIVAAHAVSRRLEFSFWLVGLRDALPKVRIPLTDEVPSVMLDLQEIFDATFDGGNYSRVIDYRREPTPLLNPDDTIWIDTLLREKGFRS